MNKRFKLIIIIGLLIVVSIPVFTNLRKDTPTKKTHYHAGFVVFKDNNQIDFSDFKHMVIKPCTVDNKDKKESREDDQIEKVHLHDLVGDVVHVERENAKWSDLFTNLKFTIDYKNTTVYLNGKKVNNFQNLIIHPYDSLMVLIGSSDYKALSSKAVSKKHIKDVEERIGDCGS